MNQNKLSIILITVGTLLIVAAIGLFAVVATGVIGTTDHSSDLETIVGFGDISTPTPGPSPTPAAEFPPGDPADIARIVIADAEIDAPIVVKGVDDAGVMIAPDNAVDVAWYDFSAHPGFGGNAVFAGHVDYVRVGPAVFWNIKDLEPGDIIEVRLVNGTTYKYAVTLKQQYDAATAPVDTIVGATPKESVTLITCGGTFNSATHQYDKRLVVRAERIKDVPAAPGLPPGA
ncbi:MAG: class F sortase [Chloroflexi bacterium]|nr:class F sortase [Chloroflexota bacterium]